MAEKTKGAVADETAGIETKQVEIIKFHPLIAHEVEDRPFLTIEKANELIAKKYAKEIK